MARPRWLSRLRRAAVELGDEVPFAVVTAPVHVVPPAVVELLRRLGVALLQTGQATNEVNDTLEAVAAAYGVPQHRFLVLPTGVFVRLSTQADPAPGDIPTLTDFAEVQGGSLRLDQVAAVDRLSREAASGGLDAEEGLRRLDAALRSPPRFGLLVRLLGQGLLTVGFGLVLEPTTAALPAYFGLGVLVGLLRAAAARLPTVSVALPVVAAALVTVVVARYVAPAVEDDPLRLLAPPLVTFLPGATLTVATIELASDQVVAGASRLVYGIAQLLLLSFGVLAGFVLATPFPFPRDDPVQLGWWAPFAGVLAVGTGYLLFSSAPRGSLPWLLLALYAASLAQEAGALALGPELSGFVGGLVVVPVSQAMARSRHGPSALVVMLPAFWLLVPGALGFAGVSGLAGGSSGAAIEVVQTMIALFSISLGVLVGTSLTADVRSVRRSWLGTDSR